MRWRGYPSGLIEVSLVAMHRGWDRCVVVAAHIRDDRGRVGVI